jgi:hypothetical protein
VGVRWQRSEGIARVCDSALLFTTHLPRLRTSLGALKELGRRDDAEQALDVETEIGLPQRRFLLGKDLRFVLAKALS